MNCHVMSCDVLSWPVMLRLTLTLTLSPYVNFSAGKRKEARRRKSNVTSQEAADTATLEGYCRTAVHDFMPHPVARRQFMYWGAKVPEAAAIMLIRRS